MSFKDKCSVERDGTSIYVNTQLYNPTNRDLPARFQTQFTQNLLPDNPKNWCLSVVRFSVDTTDVPLFIFENDTTYSVTLRQPASGVETQVFLQYINREPSDSRNVVYNFGHFVEMVNVALDTAFTTIVGTGSLTGSSVPTTRPEFVYNPDTGLFSFIVEDDYQQSNADRIDVYMNYRLAKFLTSFYFEYLDQTVSTAGKDRRVIMIKDSVNALSGGGFQVKQEYEDRIQFYEMKSLVIKSSLPIRHELAAPVQTNQQVFTGDISIDILSDFYPYSDSPSQQRSKMVYSPGVYRYTDLVGEGNVKDIQYSIFWESISGELFPIFISPHNFCSVKLMFRRREYLT